MNPVSFVEIGAGNANAEAEFFSRLFEWSWKSVGEGGEGWFDAGGIKIGVHGNDEPAAVVPYFRVDDIGLAAQRVIELGGAAELPAADEPGFGQFVNCVSAQGARFGLHQQAG